MSKAYEDLFTAPVQADRFEEFWSAWPSHHRKVGKPQCAVKWKNQGLNAIAEKVIRHVQTCKQSESWIAGFVPMPATYLNQRRWEAAVEKGVSATVENPRALDTLNQLRQKEDAWRRERATSTLDVRALRAKTLAKIAGGGRA